MVLRAHLLFKLLIVALFLNIFSLYRIKQKKSADFIIFFFAHFQNFTKIKIFKHKFINLPWGHLGPTQNLGPISSAFLTFIVNRQTDKLNLCIDNIKE